MVTQSDPLQSMDDHNGVGIHTAAHGEPHAVTGGDTWKEVAAHGEPDLEQASDRNSGPWTGTQTAAGFLAGPVTSLGTTLEQPVSEGLQPV